MLEQTVVDRPAAMYRDGYAPPPAWKRYAGQSRSAHLIPLLWPESGGTTVSVLPANIIGGAVAFVTGAPLTQSTYGILSAVGTQGTPASNERFDWREVLGFSPFIESTLPLGINLTDRSKSDVIVVGTTSARNQMSELDDLIAWTSMRPDELGSIIGASRRSVYNWLSGTRIRAEFQDRIRQLHSSLAPLAPLREPSSLRQWLQIGEPSPFELVRQEAWIAFDELVKRAVQPLQPIGSEAADDPEESTEYSADMRRAVLAAFASAPPMKVKPMLSKREPRELTGLSGSETEVE
jgi:hypothetical protein